MDKLTALRMVIRHSDSADQKQDQRYHYSFHRVSSCDGRCAIP
ncbi:hypothetical protein EC2729250_5245 [Escherichia coli 2729250]|nr:hypothetical protein EC2845650_5201 [Escherichia coli 2845650]EMW44107.1 hypothetical protein EC2770900_5123 [Escherichia coli 2770900]ENA43620.1 hypothetical protein EC2729250_5245 [Escherichia coli 2729250]ENA59994.1 hypothetical protein EC2726950_5051 [Escherichia coli 2726950]ENB14412.1 hypothetical protein ECBCE011MS01_5078 [Escherichia coli BCE011_MS-01]ENB17453.1 hypothetical protein EC2875150_5305 [Escherichia coli 2875150]